MLACLTRVISHDLQEPLRAISGCLDFLESSLEGELNSYQSQGLNLARESAQRMLRLVRDLATLSIENTREMELVDLNLAVEDAKVFLCKQVVESGAQIQCSELPTIRGSRARLAQMFQNLIGNSIKFCDAQGPRVEITADYEGDNLLLRLSDNGIGIPESDLSRIFDLAFRAHNGYEGSGLGALHCRTGSPFSRWHYSSLLSIGGGDEFSH